MYVLYEVLLYLVLLVALPWFLLTGVLRGKYLVNFPARMGFYKHRAEDHESLNATTVLDLREGCRG